MTELSDRDLDALVAAILAAGEGGPGSVERFRSVLAEVVRQGGVDAMWKDVNDGRSAYDEDEEEA
jgi:hypothetical protein